jgi:hypothetical protein
MRNSRDFLGSRGLCLRFLSLEIFTFVLSSLELFELKSNCSSKYAVVQQNIPASCFSFFTTTVPRNIFGLRNSDARLFRFETPPRSIIRQSLPRSSSVSVQTSPSSSRKVIISYVQPSMISLLLFACTRLFSTTITLLPYIRKAQTDSKIRTGWPLQRLSKKTTPVWMLHGME